MSSKDLTVLAYMGDGVARTVSQIVDGVHLPSKAVYTICRGQAEVGNLSKINAVSTKGYHKLYWLNRGEEVAITQKRFNELMAAQSSICAKVYEAVPIQEAWDHSKIYAEMRRLGLNEKMDIVMGCLNTMVKGGLITEPSRGYFKRIKVRAESSTPTPQIEFADTTKKPETETKTETNMQTNNPASPLVILGELATRLTQLAKDSAKLATDLEAAAIEIDETMQAGSEEMQKLRQLKDLIKVLT